MARADKTLSKKLEGETWTKRVARIGLPILVSYARERRKITYGEWAKAIKKTLKGPVNPRNLDKVAGLIGNACKAYADRIQTRTPEINLMVVNKRTSLPGKGANLYIKRFCKESLKRRVDPKTLSTREKQAIIGKAIEEIFAFPDWEDVLEAYGLAVPETGRPNTKKKRKRVRPNKKDWHTGPESDAHKDLKQRIASDPRMVGVKTKETGQEEKWLWSGDKVDVYFKGAAVAVEVKAGNAAPGELHRGVFQCIKYMAVHGGPRCAADFRRRSPDGGLPTGDRWAYAGRSARVMRTPRSGIFRRA